MLLLAVCCSSIAHTSQPWSGKVIYDVTPLNVEASEWDYLPHTMTYETNGKAWKITEKGTSFERIWMGTFERLDYHVIFNFLGHAVELIEQCPTTTPNVSGQWYEHDAPCSWAIAALPKSCTLKDGPSLYQINVREKADIPDRKWDRKAFELPAGY